jgi:hypothetical protein
MIRWINDIETMAVNRVYSKADGNTITFDVPYVKDANNDAELLIGIPYTDIYRHYLSAQIDQVNDEIGSYNNNMILYNSVFSEFAADYRKNHKPVSTFTGWGY